MMQERPARTRSFTLIELLVVISIIVTLSVFLAVGLTGAKDKATQKSSRALVDQIKIALQLYHSEFRDYPPDGYDAEPGWDVTAGVDNGVDLGDGIRFRGTAALIFFLCRPLTKTTRIGADDDPRNLQRKRVGPFLKLRAENLSMEDFNPNHPWADAAYWGEYSRCEILDSYRRPLCYDKVKTASAVYFQADRFQNNSSSSGDGSGRYAHPDQDAMAALLFVYGDELPGYEEASVDLNDMEGYGTDPRYTQDALAAIDWERITGFPGPGTTATHEPKFTGGYDLWSYGKSFTDPRDDLTSWSD